MFKITCPEEWDKDYMLECIITRGYFVISRSPAGPLPLYGTLKGFNYINFPTGALLVSPVFNSNWECTFGVDGTLIYLEHDLNRWFYRLSDIVKITAQRLASADSAIDINLFNSKISYIAEAETKAQKETIEKVYDEISEGNPLVVYRKDALTQQKNGLQVFFNNVKQNYVADIIQDTKRSIMNEFLTSLGINNANTDKRERLITNEVDANNVELDANTAHWQEALERQTKEVNRIFPEVDFKIELRYASLNKKSIMNLLTKGGADDTTQHNRAVGDAT